MCLSGEIWILVLCVWKTVECFKHCLMGHIRRNEEDNIAACDLINCGGLPQEIPEGEKKLVRCLEIVL